MDEQINWDDVLPVTEEHIEKLSHPLIKQIFTDGFQSGWSMKYGPVGYKDHRVISVPVRKATDIDWLEENVGEWEYCIAPAFGEKTDIAFVSFISVDGRPKSRSFFYTTEPSPSE
jgi:hypothetical protein